MRSERRSCAADVARHEYHAVRQEALEERVVDEADRLAPVDDEVERPAESGGPVVPWRWFFGGLSLGRGGGEGVGGGSGREIGR